MSLSDEVDKLLEEIDASNTEEDFCDDLDHIWSGEQFHLAGNRMTRVCRECHTFDYYLHESGKGEMTCEEVQRGFEPDQSRNIMDEEVPTEV